MSTTAETWNSTPAAAAVQIGHSESRVATKRDLGFDAARLVASMAIVWTHNSRSDTLALTTPGGSFGTAFFVAASAYFLALGLTVHPDREFSGYAQSRFKRLYVPFVAWSVIYILFRDFCRHFVMHEPYAPLEPMNLLTGGETHLWFLSFAVIMSLAAFPIVKTVLTTSAPRQRIFVALCVAIGIYLMFSLIPVHTPGLGRTNFFVSSRYVLPSAFFGIAIGMSPELIPWLRRWGSLVPAVTAVVAIICITLLIENGVTIWAKNVAGTAWLIFGLTLPPMRWRDAFARWAPLGFGLYLIHPLIQGCLRALCKLGRLDETISLDLVVFALTIAITLYLASRVQHSPKLRWLVP